MNLMKTTRLKKSGQLLLLVFTIRVSITQADFGRMTAVLPKNSVQDLTTMVVMESAHRVISSGELSKPPKCTQLLIEFTLAE
jgi:hypothetical protein